MASELEDDLFGELADIERSHPDELQQPWPWTNVKASDLSAAVAETDLVQRSIRPPSGDCLYVDIETVPDYERMHLFGLPELPADIPETPYDDLVQPEQFVTQSLDEAKVMLAGRNPEPSWIDAVEDAERAKPKPRKGMLEWLDNGLRAAKGQRAAAERDQRKLMSTTPEFCRVVAMGWAVGGHNPVVRFLPPNPEPGHERALLQELWLIIQMHRPIIGYFISAFDLPVILARSILLNVQPTCSLNASRYSGDVIDLYFSRFSGGASSNGKGQPRKLKDLARLYGIEIPAGDTDGSDVERLWREDPARLGEYVRSDVAITRELHRKWAGYFCQP